MKAVSCFYGPLPEVSALLVSSWYLSLRDTVQEKNRVQSLLSRAVCWGCSSCGEYSFIQPDMSLHWIQSSNCDERFVPSANIALCKKGWVHFLMNPLALLHTLSSRVHVSSLTAVISLAASKIMVHYMPFLVQPGHKQEGRLPAFERSRKMGHFRRQMFDNKMQICLIFTKCKWAAVKSPADSSEVQIPLLFQRKCWFLTDGPSKIWRGFICISYMGQAWGLSIFWKISALI